MNLTKLMLSIDRDNLNGPYAYYDLILKNSDGHYALSQPNFPAHTIPVVVCYRYNSLVSPFIVILGDSCGSYTPNTSVLGECVNQPTYTT